MAKMLDSSRQFAETTTSRATTWWSEALQRHESLDLSSRAFTRDVEAFGSVFGSAIALRLFLFVIPANVALVGLVNLLRLGAIMNEHLEASVTTGEIARNLDDLSWWSSVPTFLGGVILTLWAGRSLARVLATSSGAAWSLSVRDSKSRISSIPAMTVLLFSMIVASAVFKQLRDAGGIAVATTSWLAVIATTTLTWFLVMLTLPRGTRDPGALLPGAAMFAVAYTALQWFMQFYLPSRISKSSDRIGSLAITVAVLGNLFFIGRLMSASFVASAVIYERFGSLSHLVFELPLLRRLPARSPKLAMYFALSPAPQAETAEPEASDSDLPGA